MNTYYINKLKDPDCPICKYISSDRIHFLPVQENGVIVGYYRLKESGPIYNKILSDSGGILPNHIIIERK